MIRSGRGTRTAVAVSTAMLALAGLLAGCQSGVRPARAGDRPVAASVPVPRLVLASRTPAGMLWDRPLRLAVLDGSLASVTVTDDRGAAVSGLVAEDGRGWSSETTLVPSTGYRIEATLLDGRHRAVPVASRFTTRPAQRQLRALITPGDGDVIGVGLPVVVQFNRPVPNRAAVQRRLRVTMSQPVTGAWHWMSDTEVHYRPRNFWPSGERVAVTAAFTRAYFGDSVWGASTHTARFQAGAAHISTVDVAAHRMVVTSNGRVLRVLKVSTGRDKYPTVGGVHIALEKTPQIIMDSQTVGIPRNAPDGYYEKVLWDVRISYGGAFVHAAPWSVRDQGVRNVSHGCVNLSTADAEWFYGLSRRGDVVNIVHSRVQPSATDPGTADWNMPWSAWLAGSAVS